MPEHFKKSGWITLGGGKTYHPNRPTNWDEPYSWSQDRPYFPFAEPVISHHTSTLHSSCRRVRTLRLRHTFGQTHTDPICTTTCWHGLQGCPDPEGGGNVYTHSFCLPDGLTVEGTYDYALANHTIDR